MSDRRRRGIEKNLKRVISDIIRHDLEISGSDLLSVTRVKVSPDLRNATVYVSHMDDSEKTRETVIERVRRQEQSIRSALANELPLKHIPDLRFLEDESIKRAARLNDIMYELKEERRARNQERES